MERDIILTINGTAINGLSIVVGTTVNWFFTCMDPDDISAPLDLTACAVVMAMVEIDSQGNPSYPAVISRLATITSAADGECTVPWSSSDTCPDNDDDPPVPTPITLGSYGLDVWVEDVDGNRIQELGFSIINITAAAVLPESSVTALPEQEPLAQGPQGEQGIQGIQGEPGETFPTQTGKSGKFLQTDGADVSWEDVDAFPDQTGNAGKFLQTDGADVSWEDGLPSLTSVDAGAVLANRPEGTAAWVEPTWLNILDYGGVGDWDGATGTDNSLALGRALAAMDRYIDYDLQSGSEGATLYFPPGKYYFASTI